MSKQCLNCGREISGSGNNKIFCDDCFYLVASFLKEIRAEKAPALTVFNRNLDRIREAGISEEAQRYIEKCCRRYDEKKSAAAVPMPVRIPTAEPTVHADPEPSFTVPDEPLSEASETPINDEHLAIAPEAPVFDEPLSIAPDEPIHNEPIPETPKKPASDGGFYFDIPDPFASVRTDVPKADSVPDISDNSFFNSSIADPFAAVRTDAPQKAEDSGADPGIVVNPFGASRTSNSNSELPPQREVFDYDADIEENGELPDNAHTNIFVPVTPDGVDGNNDGDGGAVIVGSVAAIGGAAAAAGNVADIGGGGGGYDGYDDDGYDGYGGDGGGGGNNGGSGDGSSRRRLILICISAVVTIILFAVLYGTGLLSRDGGDTTTAPGGSLVTPPITNDGTTAPGDNGTTAPDGGDTTAPGGNETTSDGGNVTTTPVDGTTAPVDETTAPDNETTAPDHVHEWTEATCTEARTCSVCGETDGAPLGHDYGMASCDEAAVCQRCGENSGAALGHSWGAPVFTWRDNNSAATAVFTCTRDRSHTETMTATVTSSTTEATCTETGGITYTASVTRNGNTFTDQRNGAATPALGHSWDTAPTFKWISDSTATATFTCSRDQSHTETVTATVRATGSSATCTEAGTTTNTATVTHAGKTYTDTNPVSSPATGHKWGAPEFKWSSDYKSCTVSFTCENDSSHVAGTSDVNITSETKDAGCTTAGSATYTATAQFDGQSYSSKETVEIPALGHVYENGSLKCSRCGESPSASVSSIGSTQRDKYSEIRVTVLDVHRVVGTNHITITVEYQLDNASSGQAYDPGSFKMYLKSGKMISASDVYSTGSGPVFPGDSREFSATFSVPISDEVLLLEYHSADYSYGSGSQMFTDNPGAALYWTLD